MNLFNWFKPKVKIDPLTGNDFYKELLEAHNSARITRGIYPLQLNQNLCNTAQQWANIMSQEKRLYHAVNFGKRFTKNGYKFVKIGENCAVSNNLNKTMAMWFASGPHMKNILDKEFVDVGFGYCNGYWCVDFGKPV